MQQLYFYFIGWFHGLLYYYYRKRIPEIDDDLGRRTNGNIGFKAFMKTIRYNDYRNVFYFRVPLLPRMIMNRLLPRVPDCKIQCERHLCGGGIFVHHGWGTIVLADKIGKNLDVYQNVTVGYGRNGKPTIGDNVKIYSGAVVVGNIKIGNNVRISSTVHLHLFFCRSLTHFYTERRLCRGNHKSFMVLLFKLLVFKGSLHLLCCNIFICASLASKKDFGVDCDTIANFTPPRMAGLCPLHCHDSLLCYRTGSIQIPRLFLPAQQGNRLHLTRNIHIAHIIQ